MKWILFVVLFTIHNMSTAQYLDYEVKDVSNNWINLEELTGENYTVIDFWATWCKPCVTALPKINELNKSFNTKGIKFIGVNVDGPRNQAKVRPFTSSLEINYSIVLDPDQEIMNDMNVSVLPTLIIIDTKYNEIFRHEGFHKGDENILESKLQELSSK